MSEAYKQARAKMQQELYGDQDSDPVSQAIGDILKGADDEMRYAILDIADRLQLGDPTLPRAEALKLAYIAHRTEAVDGPFQPYPRPAACRTCDDRTDQRCERCWMRR